MKKIILLCLGVAVLGACKKNSEPAPSASSRTDLLTAKNWRLSAYTSTYAPSNAAAVTTNEYTSLRACERDNFAKFSTDKSILFDEGATKCDTSDPQTESGAWDFNDNQTKLTWASPLLGGFAAPYDIVELSTTTLHLRDAYSYSTNGVSYTQTEDITFTAF